MTWLLLAIGLIVLLFGFVVLFGAPYLPTLQQQRRVALDLADLKPGQLLLELGCGDGAMLVAAAELGLKVRGYELNPILALVAWLRTRRHRRLVKVVWGNFWQAKIEDADAVYVFLLPRFMTKLEEMLSGSKHKPNLKLISYAFKIPNRKALKSRKAVYLYQFP